MKVLGDLFHAMQKNTQDPQNTGKEYRGYTDRCRMHEGNTKPRKFTIFSIAVATCQGNDIP